MTELDKPIQTWLETLGLASSTADSIGQLLVVAMAIVLAALSNFVARRLLASAARKLSSRTETTWDDIIVRHGVFDRLSRLAPALVIYVSSFLLVPTLPLLQEGVRHFCMAYMVWCVTVVINALLDAVDEIYQSLAVSRVRPIKSYLQVLKVLVFAVSATLIISTITNRSPLAFLSGLAGLTAVLLLVFKDSILGLVASVQLTANNMLHVGDWIAMPEYGADGSVIDISLNTVKIQNWDKTISTIPTYALINHSFKNWRGMQESGGRRIKRALYIDMNSVRFCDQTLLDRFRRYALLKDYLANKEADIEREQKERQIDGSVPLNGRRLTNIGTFRAYVKAYLEAHPRINKNMTFLVRQLPPTSEGIGIEIYVFSSDQVWANYEAIQADIFDHLLASLPEFDLRAFQAPAGADLHGLRSQHPPGPVTPRHNELTASAAAE